MAVAPETLAEALAWVRERLDRTLEAVPLPSEASPRRYFRLEGPSRALLLIGPDREENARWLALGRRLAAAGLPLPEIMLSDEARGFFILEDLGDERLDSLSRPGADPDRRLAAYAEAAALLADWHRRALAAAGDLSGLNPAHSPESIRRLEWDYFMAGLESLGLPAAPSPALEEEAGRLCRAAAFEGRERVLIHRDFQSRNLMLTSSGLKIIDWQGARAGPAVYDLASLLRDPYVSPGPDLVERCLGAYLAAEGLDRPADRLREELDLSAMTRLMQAVGAYVKLWRTDGLTSYRAHIRPAVGMMDELAGRPGLKDYPLVKKLVMRLKAALEART